MSVIVIGNPGSGKSSMLNGLVGRPVFKAGSGGGVSGLTTVNGRCRHNGVTYIDTPGLNEIADSKARGAEITAALREAGSVAVFFVVNAQGFRVLPAELLTIQSVLSAVGQSFPYVILLNQMTDDDFEKFNDEQTKAITLGAIQITLSQNPPKAFVACENDTDYMMGEQDFPTLCKAARAALENPFYTTLDTNKVTRVVDHEESHAARLEEMERVHAQSMKAAEKSWLEGVMKVAFVVAGVATGHVVGVAFAVTALVL